jgi:2-methylcitrate dehydratase
MRAHVKTYPCINTGQSAVAAALQMHKVLKESVESLTRIEIIMADYPVVERQQADEARSRPQSRESADHSFPFIVAVSLIEGAFGVAQYEHERWHDPRVIALMSKIVMRRDADWNAHAPGAFPCALHSWDTTGRDYLIEVPYPPGFSNNGLDETVVLEKFHDMTDAMLVRAHRERIVDATLKFDNSPSTATLDAAIATGESIN